MKDAEVRLKKIREILSKNPKIKKILRDVNKDIIAKTNDAERELFSIDLQLMLLIFAFFLAISASLFINAFIELFLIIIPSEYHILFLGAVCVIIFLPMMYLLFTFISIMRSARTGVLKHRKNKQNLVAAAAEFK